MQLAPVSWLHVLVLGLLCGVVGFRLGWRGESRLLLPIIQGGTGWLAFAWAWSFAGPLRACVAVAGWALGSSFVALRAFRARPDEIDRRIARAEPYRREMAGWLRTGRGPESVPARTARAHAVELAIYLAAALATANLVSMMMGAMLLNFMNAWVARLLGAARRRLTVRLLAWNVWSVVRVAGYVLLGAASAQPLARLAGRSGPPEEVTRLAVAGAIAVGADLLLKLALSRPARRRLAAAVDLDALDR